jgi:histidine triad (HIT) family protein
MEKCIFCSIINKESPANIEFEDNEIVAFWDIDPKAPVHILIVPVKHISSITELQEMDAELIGKMVLLAKNLAKKHNLEEDGYRLCFNVGRNSGQVVDHIHLHLLGGQMLGQMTN